MRINLLSSFAAGILLATTICGVVYLTDDTTVEKATAKSSDKVQLTASQMKEKLESDGYVVQTKEELEKTLQAAKNTEKKPADSKEQEKAVTQVVVNVADGMTSIDVANVLFQAKLIPDAFKFTQDIEARGLQNALRPGSFTVNSEMSYDQIIGTIFTN
ncbi:endolytic transglycosylase MltG [Neobacillus niacini]|uniref:endolytic transglycosylase MltG n=1 Tax=Neobacillus niacini TaxID=86668 RepID=UPI001C8EDC98|nr:endolytic transglycosylase MltG [Neobacillus niacini]MBY0148132.1 aminodeoxychorismate lyase [Neobacillus niacini]